MELRIANINDAAMIASVLHQAFREYESSYTPEGFAATVLSPGQLESRLRQNEGPTWVACFENTIVGSVSAVLKKEEAVYIRSMAILPIARGQGIGELLLAEIEQFARTHGVNRLILSTTPFLTRAIRLYERVGFKRSEEGPGDLYGTPLISMEKILRT